MFRSLTRRHPARRRGAVLIVVLAMLVLFAVLGLSFVLYSEAQLTAARNDSIEKNDDTDPDAAAAAQGWMGPFVYGTADEGNPLRGQDLAALKLGYDYGGTTAGYYQPYAGNPVPSAVPINVTGQSNAAWNLANILERDVVNYSRIPTGTPGEWFIFDPMRGNGATPPPSHNARTHAAPNYVRPYFNRAAAYTYPDRTNFFLAFQDPGTGEVVLPSFHRPDLFGSLDPTNPNWTNQVGRLRTLRPRPVAGEHPNFPPVPPNADGTYTGDVCNLKFTQGTQKNDSLWMYAGGPVFKWRGKNYTACVAPLILDLNGRVNLSVAGNLKAGQSGTGNNGLPGGTHGLGVWEQDLFAAIGSDSDTQLVIAKRQNNAATPFNPPFDRYTGLALTGRINGGRLPASYSLMDADGQGGGPNAATDDGPPLLPGAGGFTAFPQYLRPAPPIGTATAQRFSFDATTWAAELANHGSQFNPLLYQRGVAGQPGGFGHDDLIRLYGRYSDPKGRNVQTTSVPTGLTTLTNATDGPIPRTVRALTTTYSVTQQWAKVQVKTGPNPTDVVTLGPVDLNRPLPDFRKNPTLPLSPVNIWTPGAADGNYERARSARHRLARDIFIRLAGTYGYIDGTSAVYVPATGNVTVLGNVASDPKVMSMMALAQLAVNMVDYIDDDDLVTQFVWNPTAAAVTNQPADPSLDPSSYAPAEIASRVVFGTELPRLVLNEVFSGVFNDRQDATGPATRPLKRRYYIELHNPTPAEAANSPARSDAGAARLRYDPAVTLLPNPAGGAAIAPPADFNPYRIDIADVPAQATPAMPYGSVIGLAPPGTAALNPADATVFPGMTVRARINAFVHDANAPSAAATLTGDSINVVLPATAAAGANGGNQGYYLIGPRDPFEAGGVTNSLSLPDAPAGVPTAAAPVNALSFDATAGPGGPTEAQITAERDKTSVVILRRLVDPYRPAQENPALANYNPYITVDYLENLPTRDRADFNNAAPANRKPAAANLPSVGRIHPYAAAPAYGVTVPGGQAAIQNQVAAGGVAPPHTFFKINNPADNNRPTATPAYGFEWLVHLDRELVSLPELTHVSQYSPAYMTQLFYIGTAYQGHTYACNNAVFTDTLGLLEVGGRLPGTPLGGREPGRINVNTVNSVSVLSAAFGRPEGTNYFATNPTQVANVWAHLSPATPPTAPTTARTPNKVPRATVFEGGTDRPFVYGSAAWGGDNPLARTPNRPDAGTQVFVNPNAPHPYFQVEPMRKVWNSLTPVSDTFLVLMTVGFFEVENAGPWDANNPPVLGRELKDKVDGDLRVQFAGVIDRSALAVADPGTSHTTPAADLPFQTKLVDDLAPGATFIDVEALFVATGSTLPDGTTATVDTAVLFNHGTPGYQLINSNVTAAGNFRLRLGYGDLATGTGDGEWVTISGAIPNPVQQRTIPTAGGNVPVPGQVRLLLSASPTRYHGGGSLVNTAAYGNPGPQPGVKLADLKRRGLVPYFTRLEP